MAVARDDSGGGGGGYKPPQDKYQKANEEKKTYGKGREAAIKAPKRNGPSSGRSSSTDGAFYTAKSGDTLWGLAQKWGVDYNDIAALNGITDPSAIITGLTIQRPGKGFKRSEGTQSKLNRGAISTPGGTRQAQNDEAMRATDQGSSSPASSPYAGGGYGEPAGAYASQSVAPPVDPEAGAYFSQSVAPAAGNDLGSLLARLFAPAPDITFNPDVYQGQMPGSSFLDFNPYLQQAFTPGSLWNGIGSGLGSLGAWLGLGQGRQDQLGVLGDPSTYRPY